MASVSANVHGMSGFWSNLAVKASSAVKSKSPEVMPGRFLTVIVVPLGSPGTKRSTGSSSDSSPESTSCRVAVDVNDWVMLAIRTKSVAAYGVLFSRFP